MVKIKDVRASNANIRSVYPNPVAVFAGATSGIGLSTLEQLAKNTDKPTIYLVGRSQKAGAEILENLKKLNPNGSYHFISSDLALFANVDKVCDEIKSKEKKVDLMVLSPGYLDFGGPHLTAEGIDALLSLRYYARLRFVHQLLPLHPTRIVSVLAGTTEGVVDEDDLALKKPGAYGVMTCANHSSTMTTLSFEHLALEHPEVSFVHCFPGIVKTQALTRGFSWWLSWLMSWVIIPLLTPFATSVEECGERTLFNLTSARYPPKDGAGGVPKPEGVPTAKGEGAYAVGSTGEVGQGKPMAGYRERGLGETIWAHTLGIYAEVGGKTK